MDAGTDILLFYSKSKDLPAGTHVPGRLYQEHTDDPEHYLQLNAIPNWRRVLSNFHVFDFTIEVAPDTVLTFRTIEHGFHYFKIKIADPSRAFEFALESGSKLSKGDGLDARRARKIVVLSEQDLKTWEQQRDHVLEMLATCRYTQDPLSKQVLLATQDAQLWHIVSRSTPVRFEFLERLRDKLRA